MNNKTRTILIVILAIGFLASRFWPKSQRESIAPHTLRAQPTPTSSQVQKAPAKTQAQIAAWTSPAAPVALTKAPIIVAKSITSSEQNHKPPEGSVPYTYVNGWVTAYGDILLGKPKNPDFPPSGFIEAPHLNLWPQGVIPFSIHESLPNPERVMRVIAYMNENTPLRFVPYTGQADDIVFFPMDGLCVSYLGRIGGNQPIYLDSRCSDHEITHELMHALGFIHEHSRADRDQFVRILWNNIESDKVEQFDVTPPVLNDPTKGRPFDYTSAMIYSDTAFARERGAITLQSLTGTPIAPVSTGLSTEDLERLRLLYGK